MTLTELRYIVAVARERHFGRAAEACFVSQPTLSVAVRKLEDELNISLFERSSTEVSVTPGGRQIVSQAQRVLEEAAKINLLAMQGRDELVGVLRLGVIFTIGPYLLPKLIPLLRHTSPQMPLHIEENLTVELSERLKQGKLDAIIISLPYAATGILTENLYEEPFVVLVPKGHALEKRNRIAARSLAQENVLLLGPGHCFRDQVLQMCPDCGLSGSENPQQNLQGSSLETMRLMVASGMGVTILPFSSIQASPGGFASHDLVSVRPFADPVPRRTVAIAWRRSFTRPAAIQALAEAIRACPLGDQVTRLD